MGSQHGKSAAINALKSFSILIVLLTIGMVAAQSAQAASAKIISDSATGGDCTTFGIWDGATKTCTMTADVNASASNGIEIISNGITLDGNGFSVIGTNGFTTGVPLSVRTNVTVKNLTISQFSYGFYLLSSSSTTLTGNTVSGNAYGLYEVFSTNSQVFNNNFINNGIQAYVTGGSGNVFDTPAGGNFWSNYSIPTQGCDDNNGNFVCDLPYAFTGGIDNIPWRDQDGWKYTPPPDTTPPNISSVQPAGNIDTNFTTVSIDYNDPGSNIDLTSIVVTLDGIALTGCTSGQSNTSCPVANLPLGAHSIGGSLADNRGNVSTIIGSFDFTDTTAPVVGTVLPSGTVNSTSIMITAGYSDGTGSGINPASISVLLDGTPVSGCVIDAGSASCAVSGLGQGNHNVSISVNDVAGNSGTGMSSFSVDSLPPVVSGVAPSGTITTGSTTVSASFSDSQSPINTGTVIVSLDGNTLSGCTVSATDVSCQVSNLVVGAHTIGGSVSDTAGNTAAISGSFDFSDTTAPFIASIQPSARITSSTATLTAGYNDGTGSGIDTSTVVVQLDGSAVSGCTAGAVTVYCNVSGLTDGSHTILVTANDRAGNTGSGTGTFTVDTTGPVITPTRYISASATGGDCPSIGVWDGATKTCTLTGDYYFANKNGIQITANGVTLDGNGHTISGSTAYNSGVAYTVKSGVTIKNLTVKSFNYGIYMVASTNNTVTENTILSNKNGIYMSSSSNNSIYGNSISSNITQQIVVAGGSGNIFDVAEPIGGNYWSNYDTPEEGCTDLDFNGFCDSPLVFTGGQDNLPRVSPPNQWVDITPPNVTSVTPSGTINTDSTSINISYFDLGTGVDSSTVVVKLDGTTLLGCTVGASEASCPVSGLALGAHNISGSLADTAGNSANISGSFNVEILSDTTAPTINSIQPSGTIATTSTNLSANYSDSGSGINSSTVAVYLDGAIRSGCAITASSVNCSVAGLADGVHNISVNVADNAGNTGTGTGSFTVSTVTPDTTPPTVNNILPSGTITSTSATVTAYLNDAGSGLNVGSVVTRIDGIAITGCTVTASSVSCPVSGIGQGAHAISVTATDNAGNIGTGNGSFTVDSLAPSVTGITPTGTITSAATTVYANYTDAVSGINTASVSVSVDSVALSGCTVAAGSVSCPASGLADGSHTISVSVSDNAGNTGTGTGSFIVNTVVPDTTAPSVTNILPTGTITTTTATISAYYTDADSGINSATATVYLDGTAMSGCTVTATGVSCPASGLAQGAHSISVSVADNAGNTGTGSGSFTVASAPSCTSLFTDNDGSTIQVFTDSSYTTPFCLGNAMTPNTDYYMEVSDPSMNLNNGQANNYLSIYTTAATPAATTFGNGSSQVTFTQASSSSPYRYRTTFRTPSAADIYNLYLRLDDNTTEMRVRYIGIEVGGTAGYVKTFSDAGYSQYADAFGNSDTVYVEVYDPSMTSTNIGTSTYASPYDFNNAAGTNITASSVSYVSAGKYRMAFQMNGTDGDKVLRTYLRNTSSTTFGQVGILVHIGAAGADTTAPSVTNVLPTGTISTSSTTVSASYSDAGSGINSATAGVYLDGTAMTGCTATASGISCPATGLASGAHSISVSVADNSGNTGTGTGSFTVSSADTTAPSVTNVLPTGTITTSSTTVSASYSDAGSGINSATAGVYLDGTAMTGCTATATSISCPATGLASGAHSISVSVADVAGNTGTGTGSFTVNLPDTTAPSVTNVLPTGTITTSSTTVSASYSDAGSGINSASANIYLDGTAMTGCTATASGISCPATGLANGAHSISVSVADVAGNTGTGTGSFTVNVAASCTTDYTDVNGATIAVYSDSAYTTKVCQQTQLNANTDYYVQITHPTMTLSGQGTQTNTMVLYNMMNTATNFGNGSATVTFTQQSGGAPYRYRATFRTPATAGVYALQTDVRSSAGGTNRVYTRGWNIRVGSTANYVRTFSNAAYTTYSDTFAPGSTVYMEIYDSAFTAGTPTTGQSGITWGTNWSGTTSTGTVATATSPTSKVFRMSFVVPAGAGDKYIYARVRNSGGTTLAGYVRVLIHVQ